MATDDLSEYLESLEREDDYRVDRVLKSSGAETTERVFAHGADGGEHGPYIRKRIARDSGMGDIYERIWQANREGRRFAHIPFVHDFYRTENHTVVVMEHVNGQTLADVVYERDPGVKLAAELFPALCDAVSELHESFDPPIIHRDLKPGNVMVRNGVPVLIDFGIAREYHDAAETDTTALGTRAYAPPEQFGYEQTTVRSDVYTLGLLLYYLLVEQTPTPKALRRGFQDARIPEQLRRIIVYATAFDPKERYESAAELKFAFLDALAHCAPVTAAMTPDAVAAAREVSAGLAGPVAGVDAGSGAGLQDAYASEATRREGTDGMAGTAGTPQGAPQNAAPGAAGQPTGAARRAMRTEPPTKVPTTHPTPESPAYTNPQPKTAGIVGRIRNWAILGFYALLVLFSWAGAIDPTLVKNAFPAPYHQYMYIVYTPLFVGIFAYAGLDKNRLEQRFPSVPWPRGSQTIIAGLLLFAVLIIFAFITGSIAGYF